jgi:hypothetical protein
MTEALSIGGGDPTKGRNVATVITPVVTIATVTPNLVQSISSIGDGVQIKGRNAGTLTIPAAIIVMPTPEPSQRIRHLIGGGGLTLV